jgi:hypothetical protein
MSSFNQSQWPSWAYGEVHDTYPSYSHFPNYSSYLADSMETYQTNHHHLVHHHQMSRTTESKPRLSKEEVEILEAEFQKNHKPNSTTKKALAESMRVDNARINVGVIFPRQKRILILTTCFRTGSRTAVLERRRRGISVNTKLDRRLRRTSQVLCLPKTSFMSASSTWLLQVRLSPPCKALHVL